MSISLRTLSYLISIIFIMGSFAHSAGKTFACGRFYSNMNKKGDTLASIMTKRMFGSELYKNEVYVLRKTPAARKHPDGSKFSSSDHKALLGQLESEIEQSYAEGNVDIKLEEKYFDQGFLYLQSLGHTVLFFNRLGTYSTKNQATHKTSEPEIVIIPSNVSNREEYLAKGVLNIVTFEVGKNLTTTYEDINARIVGMAEAEVPNFDPIQRQKNELFLKAVLARQSTVSSVLTTFNERYKVLSSDALVSIHTEIMENSAFAGAIQQILSGSDYLLGKSRSLKIVQKQLHLMIALSRFFSGSSVVNPVNGLKAMNSTEALLFLITRFNPAQSEALQPAALKKALGYFETIEKLVANGFPLSEILWLANETVHRERKWPISIDAEAVDAANRSGRYGLLSLFVDPADEPAPGSVRIRFTELGHKLDRMESDSSNSYILERLRAEGFYDVSLDSIANGIENMTRQNSVILNKEMDYKNNKLNLQNKRRHLAASRESQKTEIVKYRLILKLLKLKSAIQSGNSLALSKLETKLDGASALSIELETLIAEIDFILEST